MTEHRFTPDGELKANPDILPTILGELNIRPYQAVHVDDSLHKGIRMAQQASILEAHAAYGVVQHQEEYALLRKVSHLPDADVQRETALLSRPSILPTHTLDRSDAMLQLIDFEAFGGAQP